MRTRSPYGLARRVGHERSDEPVRRVLGGLHVRLAAALAPEKVGGLVLVDPSHEDMLDVVESSTAARVTGVVLRLVAWSAPLGVSLVAGRGLARVALAEHRHPLTTAQVEGECHEAGLRELLTGPRILSSV